MAERNYRSNLYLYESIYLAVAENEVNNKSIKDINYKVYPVKLSELETLFKDFSREIDLLNQVSNMRDIDKQLFIQSINEMLQNAFHPNEDRLTLFLYKEDKDTNKMHRIDRSEFNLSINDFKNDEYYISTQYQLN